MGHERTGLLPKSQTWRNIVRSIGEFDESRPEIDAISESVIRNVVDRFLNLETDTSLHSAFQFLTLCATATRSDEPAEHFRRYHIELPKEITALSLAKVARDFIAENTINPEYGQLATSAVVDTISNWYQQCMEKQGRLFPSTIDFHTVWHRTSVGAGFCILAQHFFASFTERYLNYYLDREATSALPDVETRDLFSKKLTAHIDEISQHAFETARITQSFAAGWFNRNARDDVPSHHDIHGFLRHALGKLSEELQRTSDGHAV